MDKKYSPVKWSEGITTVLFDNRHQLLHDRIDIRAVSPMTEREYQVGGSTALLDAVGRTIHKLVGVQKNTAEEYRAGNVMFVIITDGEENSGREYSAGKVKAMIEEKKRYGWEFVFLGANIDAVETAGRFGIAPDRAVDYVPDGAGTELNFQMMSEAVTAFRATQAMPQEPLEAIRRDMKKRGGRKKPCCVHTTLAAARLRQTQGAHASHPSRPSLSYPNIKLEIVPFEDTVPAFNGVLDHLGERIDVISCPPSAGAGCTVPLDCKKANSFVFSWRALTLLERE